MELGESTIQAFSSTISPRRNITSQRDFVVDELAIKSGLPWEGIIAGQVFERMAKFIVDQFHSSLRHVSQASYIHTPNVVQTFGRSQHPRTGHARRASVG